MIHTIWVTDVAFGGVPAELLASHPSVVAWVHLDLAQAVGNIGHPQNGDSLSLPYAEVKMSNGAWEARGLTTFSISHCESLESQRVINSNNIIIVGSK